MYCWRQSLYKITRLYKGRFTTRRDTITTLRCTNRSGFVLRSATLRDASRSSETYFEIKSNMRENTCRLYFPYLILTVDHCGLQKHIRPQFFFRITVRVFEDYLVYFWISVTPVNSRSTGATVSFSFMNALDNGLSVIPIVRKCLFSKQCPVMIPVTRRKKI